MTANTTLHATPRRAPAGSIVLVVIGSVLTLLGFSILSAGIITAGVAAAQGPHGFLTSQNTVFATDTYALTTPRTSEFAGDRASPDVPFDIGQIRLRAEGNRPLFIGIASQADVDRYLSGVHRTEVTGVRYRPFQADYRDIPGAGAPTDPTLQTIWVKSSAGSGPQEITWTIRPGSWAVVVMNLDGSPGVAAHIQAGFRSALLAPIAFGVLSTGIVLILVGLPLLLLGAVGVGRSLPRGSESVTSPTASPELRPMPVRLVARAGEPLSRGLWLVKWLLAIPHYLLLLGLWVAFLVSTIAAGFAILFTGRYPRSLFEFNVGVLRWSWRVGFYAYSALGTDRYPPFTLVSTDYPADLQVDYPERLSNGLVLVKWWLLAIPHYLVLAALTGGAIVVPSLWPWFRDSSAAAATTGFSLLGILVLIAGVLLLFTARYPAGVFDLVIGINRWVYRVAAYVALMRDDYPPFRLDQGPDEPVRGPVVPDAPKEDSLLP